MNENNNIFINKKILIYGIGRSGISALKFLKRYSNISLFDDDKKIKVNKTISSKIITYSEILKSKFDIIILSPGINIKKYFNKFCTFIISI